MSGIKSADVEKESFIGAKADVRNPLHREHARQAS